MALNDYVSAVDVIKLDGTSIVVGTPTVTVMKVDSSNNVLLAKGATLPTDGDAGYAVGCIFIDTDAGVGTTLYMNEGSATSADFNAITTSGGGGVNTWDGLYTLDKTLTINSTTLTFALTHATNNGLTLTGDSGSAGHVIQITNDGSGNDINGTSNTWSVSKAGAGLFTTLADSATNGTLAVDGNGSGGVNIGSVSTGAITLGAAVNVAASKLVTIAGVGGSDMLSVTAGDVTFLDSSLAITDADNAATFTVTNNTATSASVIVIAGSGVFTGNTTSAFATLTASGLTTGTVLYIPAAGLTTGKVINIVAAAQTSGTLLTVTGGGSNISSGTLADFAMGAATSGNGVKISSTGVYVTGSSGLLNVTANSATTTTGLVQVSATGLTTGSAVLVTGGGANLAAGGQVVEVAMGAATAGNGLTVTTTGTYTGTGVARFIANSATTGNGIVVSMNGLTTGLGVSIASSATAITGAGRLFYSNHSGATSTSGTLNEFASAANDESIVLSVTASAALAAGKLLNLSAAAVTTGTILDISDNTAHTTGTAVNIVTNSADTGTRVLLNVKQDHASATGSKLFAFTQDAPTSTNYFKAGTFNGYTLWIGNGTTPNGNLSGTAGDWLIGGDSGKGYFCTGTTNWTAFA